MKMKSDSSKHCAITERCRISEVPVPGAVRASAGLRVLADWNAEEAIGGAGAVQIRLESGERVLGTITAAKGEDSPVSSQLKVRKADLRSSVYLSRLEVHPEADQSSVVPLLLYSAMRRGRIWQRHQVVSSMLEEGSVWTRLLALQPLPALPLVEGSQGTKYRLRAQRLDYAMDRAFDEAARREQKILPEFLVQEIMDTLDEYIERIWETKYFRAVHAGTLARQQYVYMLSNMYQFVRFTTRLLGRAVAHSGSTELRTHFIRHLQGEVNHELIIERDLAYMGEDVRFVMERMVPNREMRQFMSAQESMIGFYQDPILLMAAPLAAESVAGRLTSTYVDALHACVKGWGIHEPSKATHFYTSHIQTDGGEDGHFAATVRTLVNHLTDETALQRFLSVLGVTTDALERGYDAFIDDAAIWSARCE
jgi:hypothetical protein